MANLIPPPPIQTKLFDAQGRITMPWISFFQGIYGTQSVIQQIANSIVNGYDSGDAMTQQIAGPILDLVESLALGGNISPEILPESVELAIQQSSYERTRRIYEQFDSTCASFFGANPGVSAEEIAAVTIPERIIERVVTAEPGTPMFGTWQPWTPAVSASGVMIVSGVTINAAEFLTQGPTCWFTLDVSFTLGGTADAAVILSLPFTPAVAASSGAEVTDTVAIAGVGRFNGSDIEIRRYDGANWTIGAAKRISLQGHFHI